MTAPRRVTVISPHPDDEAIGCGGTLARHAANGAEVRVIFLTSGEHGGHGAPPAQTAARREAEAHAAARVLGVAAIEFWRERDGALTASRAVIERLRDHVAHFAPERLYVTHSAEMHPDHRAAARGVAVRDLDPALEHRRDRGHLRLCRAQARGHPGLREPV